MQSLFVPPDYTRRDPILSGSVVGQTQLEFTDLDSDASYELIINNGYTSLDNTDLFLRTSTDNGVSYDSGASDYHWSMPVAIASSVGFRADFNASSIQLNGDDLSSDNTELFTGCIKIYHPGDNSNYTFVHMQYHQVQDAGGISSGAGGGQRLNGGVVNAFEITPSSGNMTFDWELYERNRS